MSHPRSVSLLAVCASLGLVLASRASAWADDLYAVTASPGKAVAGGKGQVSVTLEAKNGWKLNDQAPVSLKVTPGAGLTVDKPKLGRKDLASADKHTARFDVPFTATEAGKKSLDAEAAYVICQESACKQVKEKLTVAVNVDPAGKAAGKPKK
jgi:DsbC/DsbD-like thiol-disulfide interchange protein